MKNTDTVMNRASWRLPSQSESRRAVEDCHNRQYRRRIRREICRSRNILIRAAILLGIATAISRPVLATVLFKPVGRPPEVFTFNGVTMSQPLTSNPYALNSPKVYLIFAGPNWVHNGIPSAALYSMVDNAKAILKSSYLSGLKQYGSDGRAVYGGFAFDPNLDPLTWSKDYALPDGTIDHTNNPMWFEIDQILSNPNYWSWYPPGGNARYSPIYVVVRYTGASSPGGSNNYGPNSYTSRAVNGIDVAITSADQVDQFSWVFSHEIVERISSGIGGLREISPDDGGQIADGEPEGSNFYAWRLGGLGGTVVTSYWSVLDQAFIVPDGKLQRLLVVPIWDGSSWTGKCISLQQGSLYEISPPDGTTLIDSQVQAYATSVRDGNIRMFVLTSTGQVKEYSDSSTYWTALTGSNTVASAIVTLPDGALYMLASNDGGPKQIWLYRGSGTGWTAVTGANTTVNSMTRAYGDLYMLSGNEGLHYQVWRYSGSGATWTAVTGTNTYVIAIAAANDSLYMVARNDGPDQVWVYGGSDTTWTAVTGTNTRINSIAVSGDVLCMTGTNDGGFVNQLWQYGLAPNIWMPLIGADTSLNQIVVQDGMELYMLATNDGSIYQVWQYSGAPNDWIALTGMNTKVLSISVGANNHLYMNASNDGGPFLNWAYDGSPYSWQLAL